MGLLRPDTLFEVIDRGIRSLTMPFWTAGNVSELLPLLKDIPAEEVARKQENVRKYASYFRYRQTPAEELHTSPRQQTASDAILEAICEHARGVGTRYKGPRALASSKRNPILSFFEVRPTCTPGSDMFFCEILAGGTERFLQIWSFHLISPC